MERKVMCMSQQVTDPFIWEKEEWIFLGADNVYDLFDPEKYGLSPEAPHTACWKGFVVTFELKNGQLYLKRLLVNTKDDVYPSINGISAIKSGMSFHEYKDLNIKLGYSGTIIVGQNMKNEFRGRAFTGPHSYSKTYELEFSEGLFKHSKETSGSYFGF